MEAARKHRWFLLALGARLLLFGLVLFLLSGCYIVRQGCGQLDILLNRRNVDDVLGEQRPPQEKEKIRLVLEVKAYGERALALRPTDNYTTFFDTRGKPVSYAVTACRKDRFQPYTWWFPIVGSIPYKGFFDREDAREEAADLEREGYDVSLGVVGGYSTLGWFSDPIFSSMLDDSEEDLAELILHELTHSTVYASGHGDFNESLATFVGREGALEFCRLRWGEKSEIYRRAVDGVADEGRFDDFMQQLFAELQSYYAARPPDFLVGRERIFATAREKFRELKKTLHDDRFDWFLRIPLNNATILGRRRYGRVDSFRKHFDATGRDWSAFFAKMRRVGEAVDPMKALEN